MEIKIRGARTHNLKNISLSIPKGKLVVVTGVSGSGKSSLVIDTIFAEGQRQYLESLSAFARRYLQKVSRPDVDKISGLSPTILIDQKPLGKNPRSTVGTVTDIYTYLRLLFSRVGAPILSAAHFSFNNPSGACEHCLGLGTELNVDRNALIDFSKSLNEGAIRHRTWKVGSRYWNIIKATRFFDMNKPLGEFTDKELHLLLDVGPEDYKNDEPGFVQRFTYEGIASRIKKRQHDSRGLEVRGYDAEFIRPSMCHVCNGSRLNKKARSVKVKGKSIVEISTLSIIELMDFLKTLEGKVATSITPSIIQSLQSLIDLKLDYLSLDRSIETLSGGEAQRIKIARQLVGDLTELIYILDEPTVGLHPKDIDDLISNVFILKEKPNTILVVEHDPQFIRHADFIVDLGPGAGANGGEILAEGTLSEIKKNPRSITGMYLKPHPNVSLRRDYRKPHDFFKLERLTRNNLRNINVSIPFGLLTCLTGVSGAGKSSLIEELIEKNRDIVIVDQSGIGSSPRSTPATYVGVFDRIRDIFARTSKKKASLFSFNSEGACPTCKGLGYEAMDMHFLEDVRLVCEACKGKRYNEDALKVRYKEKNIAEVLEFTAAQAITFFHDEELVHGLQMLVDVGLGYLELGQSLDTLSGGELQRIKLATRLQQTGNFYVLDEPTTGLHPQDIEKLLTIFNDLVDRGNTVLVVEHNLDIVLGSDWIIDLGPGGGKSGGNVVATGTPHDIAEEAASYTGVYIKKLIA